MPTPANPTALAQQARRSYAERLLSGIPAVVSGIEQGAKLLAATVAEPAVALKRRELLPMLQTAFPIWQHGKLGAPGGRAALWPRAATPPRSCRRSRDCTACRSKRSGEIGRARV